MNMLKFVLDQMGGAYAFVVGKDEDKKLWIIYEFHMVVVKNPPTITQMNNIFGNVPSWASNIVMNVPTLGELTSKYNSNMEVIHNDLFN